jgi:hypothetical protein
MLPLSDEQILAEFRWKHAYEAAMAEAGYSRARMHPEGNWGTYTWTTGTEDSPWDHSDWEAGMKAQVLVDKLRPNHIQPSIALQRMLDVHHYQDD